MSANPNHRERLRGMTNNRGDYAEEWSQIKYKYLVHATENFIVFIDDDMDLHWEASPEYDAAGHEDDHKRNSIRNDAAMLEATPCDGLREDMRFQFKRLIGEAIAPELGSRLHERREHVEGRWHLPSGAQSGNITVLVFHGKLCDDRSIHRCGCCLLVMARCSHARPGSWSVLAGIVRDRRLSGRTALGDWSHRQADARLLSRKGSALSGRRIAHLGRGAFRFNRRSRCPHRGDPRSLVARREDSSGHDACCARAGRGRTPSNLDHLEGRR